MGDDALRGQPGRLRRRAEFLATAKGRRFHTDRMTVQGRLRKDDPRDGTDSGPRIGFTVTKRVGHATERNRIRRRLRVAAARAASSCGLALDLVLVARREAIAAPFDILVEDVTRALAAVTRPGRGPRSSPPPPETREDSRTP